MEERSRCLIFDPFSGVSGDMILGGLIDLGLSPDWLQGIVSALPLEVSVSITSVKRGALSCCLVTIDQHEPQPSRRLSDVLALLDAADIDATVRDRAAITFQRLAEVEGIAHGMGPDEIHFHEVGAADAIVDIVGATAGVAELGVEQCFTRPIAIGRGWTTTAHGALPLPAPATLKLLEGLPVIETGIQQELTTPTGAALLSVLTDGKALPALFTPLRSGCGAGSRDPSTRPNCLRLVLAEIGPRGRLFLAQADIDDMPPEYLPPLREALSAAGAVDVWAYPLQMKKSRIGLRVEALLPEGRKEEVAHALFRNSTTLGLRFWPVDREVLPRSIKRIEWRGFPIRIKTGSSAAGHAICKPEYEDVVQAARALGIPPLKVRQEIERLLKGET